VRRASSWVEPRPPIERNPLSPVLTDSTKDSEFSGEIEDNG
jgi:hypothetical protein